MITINSSNLTFSVQIDGDQIHGGVEILQYLKSRCTMRFFPNSMTFQKVAVTMNGTDTGGTLHTQGPIYYYTDTNGDLAIPLRDMLLWFKKQGVDAVNFEADSFADVLDTQVADIATAVLGIVEGISYNAVGSPKGKDVEDATAQRPDVIMPPNVIINPSWSYGSQIEGNYTLIDPTANWSYNPTNMLHSEINVKGNIRTLTLTDSGNDVIKTYTLADAPTCADLLMVQWTSLTGAQRIHYFPIVSFIRGNGDKIEVESLGDGYEVQKANYTAVRCRITGLTRWGYYYYMDLLQASDPLACVIANGIVEDMQPVFIDGESAETPEGTGFFNFEFVANLKQYAL
jgi:hypothetical protein